MFLHVMPKEKFTYGFVEFTFATFPDLDIKFVVYGSDNAQGYESYNSRNVVSVSSAKMVFGDKVSRRLLREADVVILNWVNMSMLPRMWRYLPKTHLLFWGGDYSPYVSLGLERSFSLSQEKPSLGLHLSFAGGNRSRFG